MSTTATDVVSLGVNDLQVAEFHKAHYVATIRDVKVKPEDVTKPEFWVNHGKLLSKSLVNHAPSEIEVFWSDLSHYMRLVVLSADDMYARVAVLDSKPLQAKEIKKKAEPVKKEVDVNSPETQLDKAYRIEWVSPTVKFGVIRVSDGERLVEGLPTKPEAEQWLADFKASMG